MRLGVLIGGHASYQLVDPIDNHFTNAMAYKLVFHNGIYCGYIIPDGIYVDASDTVESALKRYNTTDAVLICVQPVCVVLLFVVTLFIVLHNRKRCAELSITHKYEAADEDF